MRGRGFRLCGGEAVDGARLAAFQSPPPPLRPLTYRLAAFPALAGRGGSISRRDHYQAARKPRPPRMGAQLQRKRQVYSQPLFGRRGSGGRGSFSQRSRLSPQNLPSLVFSGGSAREGPFLKKRSLPRKNINSLLLLSKRLHSRDAPRGDRCRCGPCDRRKPSDDRSGGADQSAQ